MEWYSGSRIDNHDIPEDEEVFNGLPSPDRGCQWETGSPETFLDDEYPIDGDLCQKVGGDFGTKSSAPVKDHAAISDQTAGWSGFESDHTDFQLDNLEGIGWADDYFTNSSPEDFAAIEKLHRSLSFPSGVEYEVWPTDHSCLEAITPQSDSSEFLYMESSNFCELQLFSPSVSQENEAMAEQFVPCNTEQESTSPPKHKKPRGEAIEEPSLEESVLQDLEMVMSQMNEKTRICFRDALYRLADNTKQHCLVSENQGEGLNTGDPVPVTEHSRDRSRKRAMESETNIIDRTVAKIMFNPVDFKNHDSSVEAPAEFEDEILESKEQCTDSSSQKNIHRSQSYRTSNLPHDFEVPVFGQSDCGRNDNSA